jgi:hypothetical protein
MVAAVLLGENGMGVHSDMARRQALIELLAKSDPFDAQRRHRLVLEGRPDRHTVVLRLAAVYIQTKLLEMRGREAERVEAPAAAFEASRWSDNAAFARSSRENVASNVRVLSSAV